MTMEIVKHNSSKPEAVMKTMKEMKRGEVCLVTSTKQYIINVGVDDDSGSRFFMLENESDAKWYQPGRYTFSDWDLQVRELYLGESITIKFS